MNPALVPASTLLEPVTTPVRAPSQRVKRRFATVDLGELRARVDAAAAAVGLGPSAWLKDLVRRELAAPVVMRSQPIAVGGAAVYRAALDAELVAKLDSWVCSAGLRDRAAGLRALIEGTVGLPRSADVSLQEAVDALARSNDQLTALWQGLARSGRAFAVSAGADDPHFARAVREIEAMAAEIRSHLGAASKLLVQLRPLLKRPVR